MPFRNDFQSLMLHLGSGPVCILAKVLLFFCFSFSSIAVSAAVEDRCEIRQIENPPIWISSAVWDDEYGRIGLVDSLSNRLVFYRIDGSQDLSYMNVRVASSGRRLDITGISKLGDDFVIKLLGTEFLKIRVQQDTIVIAGTFNPGTAQGVANKIRSIYDWTVVGDERILAYGSYADPKGEQPFKLGFFSGPLFSVGEPEFLLPLEEDFLYSVGLRLLDSIDGAGYFVALSQTPEIYRVELGFPAGGRADSAESLAVFPSAYRQRPSIPAPHGGVGAASAIFRMLKGKSLPVQLVGHDGALYLLTRAASPAEESTWRLYKILPPVGSQAGSVEGFVTLPTRAPHLTVVPGDREWYLIERGDVDESARQNIEQFVAVPAAWVEYPKTSKLQGNGSNPGLCSRALR